MARTVRDTNLETRTARARLAARHKPHWRKIDQGCHVGYYKGKRAGSWVARRFGGNGRYAEKRLATADDVQDADGVAILSFAQAQAKAREWFREQARSAAGLGPAGPYRVREAIEDYLASYKVRGRGFRTTKYSVDAHIIPALGDIEVAILTTQQLRRWHEQLAVSPARLRTSNGLAQQYREPSDEPSAIRQRKATANRVLAVLKAALNHAYREGRADSDTAWRRVRPFKKVAAARVRYLTEAEAVRLVNACPPDFRNLVRAALATGCRYSELTSMEVSDFNADAGNVLVRSGKSGKARHVTLTDEGQRFFEQATAGRTGDETLFLRADGKPWGRAHQRRPLTAACQRASIKPAISFHILRHCVGSWLAMRGVPLAVIAHQLGHADERMAQKHYAHLAPSYVADTIRANLPQLGIVEDSNVQIFRHAGDTARLAEATRGQRRR